MYAAWDPNLDRKVALKVVRAELLDGAGALVSRERLLREARAMAKLSHPNVLTVYEVDTFDDAVCIAEEYAIAGTLGAWFRAQPRPWREILARFIEAGRGLAAAHAAGLVHRDFKPENVLLGADGRVRVADFGLVSVVPTATGAAMDLTVTGAVMGTPAYMAPEQHLGEKAGPLADQFAFCVALYEALFKEHPFGGRTYEEVAKAVTSGRISVHSVRTDVPEWLRTVLVKGLARDPAARYPSMDELLAMLLDDPDARRKKRWARVARSTGAVAAVALVAIAAWIYRGVSSARCAGSEDKLTSAWTQALREQLRSTFRASALPMAEASAEAVIKRIDAYAASWKEARRDTCEATYVRGEQSDALLDVRMRCFDHRLGELAALVQLLATADRGVVQKAIEATGQLVPVTSCDDVEALSAVVPLPRDPAIREKIAKIRAELAKVKALEDSGEVRKGLALARAVAVDAERLAFAPVGAEALYRLGRLETDDANYKGAAETLRRAAAAAAAARDDALLATIWADLASVIGFRLSRGAEAEVLLEVCEAAIERAGRPDSLRAHMLLNRARVRLGQARYVEGIRDAEESAQLRDALFTPDHPDTISSLNVAGQLLIDAGWPEEAEKVLRRVLDRARRTFGDSHPFTAMVIGNLGIAAGRRGESDRALDLFGDALSRFERSLGPTHPNVALAYNNIAFQLMEAGRHSAAAPYAEKALALYGGVNSDASIPLSNALNTLAETRLAQGRSGEARALANRALEIRREILKDPQHPKIAYSLLVLAHVAHAENDRAQEVRLLEEALALYGKHPDVDPLARARARFALAQTLWERRSERARAESLIRDARMAFEERRRADEISKIDAWIAARPR